MSKKMKRTLLLLCLPLVTLFFSCSTDVDLYAEYKEMPIIYGLLDATADTNFVKITRAFYVQGDAYQSALNPDSSNYAGKLDARLIEYCNGDSVREIILDTITLHGKQQGTFYSPDQKMYYTTEPLNMNQSGKEYAYELKVVLPHRTLVATTDMVGNSDFGPQSLAVNFSKQYTYFGAPPRQFLFRPAKAATFYDVSMSFTFFEQRTPDDDSVSRSFTWKIGTFTEDYFFLHTEGDAYIFPYHPADFYVELREFLGADTAVAGLKRYISDFPVEVTIAAGGENLRQYIYNNDVSLGFNPGDNEFSLIPGGYGVFSSRMTARLKVRLAGETIPEMVANPYWGFKFIGGQE